MSSDRGGGRGDRGGRGGDRFDCDNRNIEIIGIYRGGFGGRGGDRGGRGGW